MTCKLEEFQVLVERRNHILILFCSTSSKVVATRITAEDSTLIVHQIPIVSQLSSTTIYLTRAVDVNVQGRSCRHSRRKQGRTTTKKKEQLGEKKNTSRHRKRVTEVITIGLDARSKWPYKFFTQMISEYTSRIVVVVFLELGWLIRSQN